jgi:hypothetical protein
MPGAIHQFNIQNIILLLWIPLTYESKKEKRKKERNLID